MVGSPQWGAAWTGAGGRSRKFGVRWTSGASESVTAGRRRRVRLTSRRALAYLSGFYLIHEGVMSNPEQPLTVIVDEYLESSLDSVDAGEAQAKVLAEQIGLCEDDAYQMGYAVREAMVNAVVHGNRYSANKKVHFVLSRTASSMRVLIEDEGTGFQPEAQDDPLAEENLLNQSGRGIMIIRAFVDGFLIEKAGHGGTRVVLDKSLPPGT